MKVLVVEKNPDGALDLAMRAAANGHDVRYCLGTYHPQKSPVGRGLVEREADFMRGARWADLIIAGGSDYFLPHMDRLRAEGKLVVGSCVEACLWETDRATGMGVFRAAGIPVAPYRTFHDYDQAIAYVKRQGTPFASKPSGHCDDKALSYVANSASDLIYMMERWKRNGKRQGLEFILQEKISGVEFAVGAWFGPGGFVEEWEENFEHKKLMPGNLGPNTGEMGTVSRWTGKSKLADKVLKPLARFLDRARFVGCVDVSVIIDEEGTPWPLEFTTRGGWPALNLECSAFDCDLVEFFAGLAQGKPPRRVHRLDEVVAGVVVAIPDFPYSHATAKEVVGVPVYGLTDRLMQHVHPAQMMAGEAPDDQGNKQPSYVTAGDYVMVCTGSGESVRKARDAAYRVVRQIEIPSNPFYRNDIGDRCRRDIDELQRHGFALGLEY